MTRDNSAVLLVSLTVDTAARLQAMAAESQLESVNEQSHLAPCFRQALTAGLAGTPYRVAAPGERVCSFPDHFPRVGNVDELLVPEDGAPVWVELKCGWGGKVLWPCAWDAVKLALGVRLAVAGEAYLLAGAPQQLWHKPVLGAEFFHGGHWLTAELRGRFARAFRDFEELDDPAPQLVPETIVTEPICDPAGFLVAGSPWELRLARVTAPGDGWFRWPPFLTPSEQAVAREQRAKRGLPNL